MQTYKSVFKIAKMDCPSEEQQIRMILSDLEGINTLDFDLVERKLTVIHEMDYHPILKRLEILRFNTSLVESVEMNEYITQIKNNTNESKLLWQVLVINFLFFIIEIVFGWISNSMGLIADSLDMLADAFVYGLSLFAVGGTLLVKKKVAKTAGYLQLFLAVLGVIEVIRRFIGVESMPSFQYMIIISFLALIGNALSLFLLQRNKSEEVHMKASLIFTSNDVIVNLGVIIAGSIVYFTNSKLPDLIVGGIVFLLVFNGALRILKQ